VQVNNKLNKKKYFIFTFSAIVSFFSIFIINTSKAKATEYVLASSTLGSVTAGNNYNLIFQASTTVCNYSGIVLLISGVDTAPTTVKLQIIMFN